MNKINIRTLFPSFYDGVAEVDEIASIENNLLDQAHSCKEQILNNQFVDTADVQGIIRYEDMLNIVSNSELESLEFRKARIINRLSTSPPFSFRFLKNKFDELIGKGKWKAYIDFDTYTLFVESTASDQIWFEEILITMTRTKPCNMVFINQPLVIANVSANETVAYVQEAFNYRLGNWLLGKEPFKSSKDKGVIKMPEIKSITKEGLIELSQHMLDKIAKVRLNDTVILTDWVTHILDDGIVRIEYRVDLSHKLDAITKVELLDCDDIALTRAVVYVPMIGPVVFKHSIQVKEG